MSFRTQETWVGFGLKGGGMLFVVGAETFEGAACRLDSWGHSATEFNISGFRFGIGLGASAGVSMVLAFNIPVLDSAAGMQIKPALDDFNVSLALPEFKAGSKSLTLLARIGNGLKRWEAIDKRVIGGLRPHDIVALRDFASLVWKALIEGSDADRSRETKLMVIDIPEAGGGLEASLFWTSGELQTGGD